MRLHLIMQQALNAILSVPGKVTKTLGTGMKARWRRQKLEGGRLEQARNCSSLGASGGPANTRLWAFRLQNLF